MMAAAASLARSDAVTAPGPSAVDDGAYLSLKELADLRLPGARGYWKWWRRFADRTGLLWRGVPRQDLGGGLKFPLPAICAALRRDRKLAAAAELERRYMASAARPPAVIDQAELVTVDAQPSPGQLKRWQRKVATRRCAAMREVERLAEELGLSAAIDQVAASVGESSRTLWRWRADFQQGGWAALAPRGRARSQDEPAWAPALLKLWRMPSKRSLADVMRDLTGLLPEGVQMPSESQARRFLRKLSAVERNRGRMGPNSLKAVRAFTRRSTEAMAPCDVYISDGHTFDAEVAHPRTGKACRPEVTTVLDVQTRKAVGWSVALSESTWAVADALRHAVETHGIPGIYYADHGPGQENATVCAMLTRLGIREERSIARNSQARGVIEAFNRNLVAAAKRLPTYMGADMDKDAKNRVYKLTRRELREFGSSRLLMAWDDFLAFLQDTMDAYNARAHRALGKGISPNDAWQKARGFEPTLPSADDAADLFRPYEARKVSRGEIAFDKKRYFARHLEHLHGDYVRVGYDIHDPSRVWVRDFEDRLIAIAELDGNSRPYFPQSRIEQAREDRARAQLRRLEAKREGIEAELSEPLRQLEAPPPAGSPEPEAAAERPVRMVTRAKPKPKPELIVELDGTEDDVWYDQVRRLEMRIEAGEEVDQAEREWVERMRNERFYQVRRKREEWLRQSDEMAVRRAS